MQPKRIKRRIDGVLLLDKPRGISSNQALQQAKRLFLAAKAGHTGSLDPLATGLLPLCLGEATKFSHYLLDADKSYRAHIKLGITTTTGDAEGEVLQKQDVALEISEVKAVLSTFMGSIHQVPPMYSALKHQGKPLYSYARDGVEIERKSREVMIHNISLERFHHDELEILVSCSKGTYIRTLAEDIGAELGCGAHLSGLRRLSTGHFKLEAAVTLEHLESMPLEERDMLLLKPDSLISSLPEVLLDETSAYYIQRGQRVWQAGLIPKGMFRIYGPEHSFLGLGEQVEDGKIAPKRLLQT